MPVIGDTLRRERLKRNLGLDEISRELKISLRFLEAIEAEQFDKLPRGVFAKSFVRQYARLLELDEEELAGAVDPAPAGPAFAEQATQPAASEIRVPRVEAWENVADSRLSRSSSLPALAMVVVAMLVCSGVYALWQRMHHPIPPSSDAAVPAQQSRLPHNEPPSQPAPSSGTDQPLSAQAQPPAVQAQPPAQNSTARPASDSVAPGASQARPAVSLPVPGTAATSPAATPPQETVTTAQPPASNPNAPVRVAITADEMVWVLVRTDGKYSFSGTMEANQTRTFDGNGTVMLRLGNAGGVSIKLNGQSIPAVGPKGQVRTVQFTSGGFQIVPAPAPKPSLPLDDLL